jgi:hypothetical protein
VICLSFTLDFETKSFFDLTVQVADNHGANDAADVTISLTDIVENEVAQLTVGASGNVGKKQSPVAVLPQITVIGSASLSGGMLTISGNAIGSSKKLLDQFRIPSYNGLGSSTGHNSTTGG